MNKIAQEFYNAKTLKNLSQDFLKSIHNLDLYELSRNLKRNNLTSILEEYRDFRKSNCLCSNCNNFYPKTSYRHSKCPNPICENFYKEKWKKVAEKVKNTKEYLYNDKNFNNTEKYKQSNLLKYGVEYPLQNEKILKKLKKTNLKKYGIEFPLQNSKSLEKYKQTNLLKYGVSSPMQNPEIIKKLENTMLDKYGVKNSNYLHFKNYENYNIPFIQKNFIKNKVLDLKVLDYFGIKSLITIKNFLKDIEYQLPNNRMQNDFLNDIEKKFKISLKREYYIKPYRVDGIYIPKNTTKVDNSNSKNIKIFEFLGDYWHGNPTIYDGVNEKLSIEFIELFENTFKRFFELKSQGYKVFYIWESDYKSSGLKNLKEFKNLNIFLKNEISNNPQFYNFDKNILKQILKDFNPQEVKDFDLKIFYNNKEVFLDIGDYTKPPRNIKTPNYLEIYSLENLFIQLDYVTNGLSFNFSNDELFNEFNLIKNLKGNLNSSPIYNKIVKHFQTGLFHLQNELYKDNITRRKLIENRIQYLNKPEGKLSLNDIISGFKIGGFCKTYSYFNPLWFKYFIEKYKVKKVYDCFGGWGHRLLGSNDLDLYIYNDISKETFLNTNKIINFLKLKNVKTYNENALTFRPSEEYDSIFTCPPYGDIEEYAGEFKPENLKILFEMKAKIIGIVIREDFEIYLKNNKYKIIEKSLVNDKKSHFGKNLKEFLYVFIKL